MQIKRQLFRRLLNLGFLLIGGPFAVNFALASIALFDLYPSRSSRFINFWLYVGGVEVLLAPVGIVLIAVSLGALYGLKQTAPPMISPQSPKDRNPM